MRLALPETQAYRTHPPSSDSFVCDAKSVLRNHWLLLVYLVLLMSGFNFVSHGSQDLYPLLLASDFAFTPTQVTTTQVVANLGAMLGGTTVGFLSQSLGRPSAHIAATA